MENISKVFGSLKANNNVNLSVRKGEVHALLGENGAGKSTLMNMLSGIYTPDTGSIKIDGQEVHFASPKDSIRLGIGMIHQHFKLVDVMTAKENIIIGQPSGFFVKGKLLSQEVKKLSDQYGLDIDPDKKVYDMSVGEKQTRDHKGSVSWREDPDHGRAYRSSDSAGNQEAVPRYPQYERAGMLCCDHHS